MLTLKTCSLSEEEEFKLFNQLDNYEMVCNNLNLSFNEVVNNYKEEYINSSYTTYFEFLTNKLEELFYNIF